MSIKQYSINKYHWRLPDICSDSLVLFLLLPQAFPFSSPYRLSIGKSPSPMYSFSEITVISPECSHDLNWTQSQYHFSPGHRVTLVSSVNVRLKPNSSAFSPKIPPAEFEGRRLFSLVTELQEYQLRGCWHLLPSFFFFFFGGCAGSLLRYAGFSSWEGLRGG